MRIHGPTKGVRLFVIGVLALFAACAEAVPDEGGEGGPALRASVLANRTRLPIVLLHGMAGFDRIGPLDYYYGVKSRLVADGYSVFVTEVDPFQTIEHRAAQLAPQIQSVLTRTGASRVHLVAHSQGGLDARYLVTHLGFGNRVATVTTISTPHRGSRVADIALGILPGPAVATLAFLADLVGGGGQDLEGQAYELTEQYTTNVFNPETPDDPRVLYYSVAGVTRGATLDLWHEDICDPLLWAGYLLLAPTGANDGLVTVASAKHGTFLGTVPADHLDEVGQLLGTTALGFDHRVFYSRLARFLTSPTAPSPI